MGDENPFVGTPYRTPEQTGGSTTSRDAAIHVSPKTANLREKSWKYIRSRGAEGATAQETNDALGILHGCGTRITELREGGRILRTGRKRRNPTGGNADVYVAVDPADWIDKRDGWPIPSPSSRRKSRRRPANGANLDTLAIAKRALGEIVALESRIGSDMFTADAMVELAKRALGTINQ